MSPVRTFRAMPKFTPAPAALVARFEKAVAAIPQAETRKMFGYPAAFIHGQLFVGIFRAEVMLRLAEADRTEITTRFKAKPFEPMPGRPMREYVSVPAAILKSDAQFKVWLARGRNYVLSLPPKAAKPRGRKSKS